jgi:hypothetical protein
MLINTYMIIKSIDEKCNLFSVENIYSHKLINEIQTLDLINYPYEQVIWQEAVPRRKLNFDKFDTLARIDEELASKIEIISKEIGIEIKGFGTSVWLDLSQFNMAIHEDNQAIKVSMQVYLLPNINELGTKFYYTDNRNDLRYDFPYKVNTGYIMINVPGQFHGVPTPVPNGTFRCSSYTYLGST